MLDEADGVMLRLGIFGSWVALYELSSQDSSRRSLKRCERSQPVEPLGQILQASCSFPSTRLGPGHSLALDIKRVLTLGGGRGGRKGGREAFKGCVYSWEEQGRMGRSLVGGLGRLRLAGR
jgi:hypothetical protein